jgi:hypothetical protein
MLKIWRLESVRQGPCFPVLWKAALFASSFFLFAGAKASRARSHGRNVRGAVDEGVHISHSRRSEFDQPKVSK